MLDRFKDAQWYVGGDPLSATIFDASDPDGPGHAVVCRHAVIEDARLIAASPDMAAALYAVAAAPDHPELWLSQVVAAIAKVEGPDGGYARLLDTDPNFESFVRGYIDKAEGRA